MQHPKGIQRVRSAGIVSLGLAMPIVPAVAIAQAPQPRGWEVEVEPEVSIGMVDGPEEYLLVNVIDALALSDGTIVLGLFHRTFFELRYFSESGDYIASAGRYGDGPFEVSAGFISLERMAGDSIFVAGLDHRYSVFGPRGEQGRSGRLSLPPAAYPIGLVDDQHLAVQTTQQVGVPTSSGLNEFRHGFFIVDLDSGEARALELEARSRSMLDEGYFLKIPFDPMPSWAVGGGALWIGTGSSREVVGFPVDGSGTTRVAVEWSPSTVSRRDRSRWKSENLRGVDGPRRRQLQRYHGDLVFPDEMPSVQRVDATVDGNLWVLRYEPPWSDEDYTFEVFDSAGRPLGTASMPFDILGPSLRRRSTAVSPLSEIGNDYIIVRDKGEYGEPIVRRYRMVQRRIEGGA